MIACFATHNSGHVEKPRSHAGVPRSLGSAVILSATLLSGFSVREAAAMPDQVDQIAGLEVALWLPSAASTGPQALVLFSHGFGGCKTQSDFLMRALADNGMIVAAPDHRDNRCSDGQPPTTLPPDLVNPQNWSPTFYEGRRDDMQRLRAELERNGTPAGPVDPARVVLVGHSLGGYTALALAGGWSSWQSGEVAAVVALAPFAQPLLQSGGALGAISAPVLFQGGTADPLITEVLEQQVYPATTTASSACLIVYRDAGHLAWTELEDALHGPIAAAVASFLIDVLAGQHPTSATLTSPAAMRTVCR